MKFHFSKYHGTGNDFIMIDGRSIDTSVLKPQIISNLCDRHFSIGADGVIVLSESENHDFKMTYYNSDGYEGSMCGNGGRCICAFAKKLSVIHSECTFEAIDGLHSASIDKDGLVRLQLGDVNDTSQLKDGYFLNTGSPHFVKFKDSTDEIDVVGEGRIIRNESRFTDGTNVNFVEILASGIKVRTYERGVEDETLSCGTGATAAAIATFLHGRSNGKKIEVSTKGGILSVEFDHLSEDKFSNIYLTGPARNVFDGFFQM